jgi:hypothetical protein
LLHSWLASHDPEDERHAYTADQHIKEADFPVAPGKAIIRWGLFEENEDDKHGDNEIKDDTVIGFGGGEAMVVVVKHRDDGAENDEKGELKVELNIADGHE